MTEMPMHNDSPFYGYNVAVIQDQYVGRGAVGVVDFLLPHVKSGMSVLDAGCGPGDDNAGSRADCRAGQGYRVRP